MIMLISLSALSFGQENQSQAVSNYFFISSGNWNDGTHWNTGEVPPEGCDVIIMADAVIPAGYTAIADQVCLQGGSVTVADGGQLKHNTQGLVVTMEKSIAAFNEVNSWSNYYLLAFPFNEDVAVPATMTAAEDNDFYIFDPDYPYAEWRNNKQHVITNVGGTTGYLYANSEDIELSLTGSTYQSYGEAAVTVEVPYTEGSSNIFNGWALLGNPFTCNAYVYALENGSYVPKEFMVYNADGGLLRCSCSSIAPMQGFFVKVEEATTICIKTTCPYVDLGLPSGLLWATCNVGANAPEEYGDYFAWGETEPKSVYNWSTYQYCNNGYLLWLTKYCNNSQYGYNGYSDNLTTLLTEDDAATANWGGIWRMPTDEEWLELYQNTTNTWTTQNDVNGKLFTATNGNTLFLPSAGDLWGSEHSGAGYNGNYWSSSLNLENPASAGGVYFRSDNYAVSYRARCCGLSVRAVCSAPQSNAPTGVINGKFTINENGEQVYFSRGNLQYQASTNTWRFAENQWNYVGGTYNGNQYGNVFGSSNNNISSTYDGWIDLFGWGTSGYDHGAICYQPWSTSTNYYDYYAYGSRYYNLHNQTGKADWGYNPIVNGGNQEHSGWRTLTKNEWSYIIETRNTSSGIRYAKAQVNGVNGAILLPDDWNFDDYPLNNTNQSDAQFNSNVVTIDDWGILEAKGVVFLPAAGMRQGVALHFGVGSYWSTTYNIEYAYDALDLRFSFNSICISINWRYDGASVRLVRDAE